MPFTRKGKSTQGEWIDDEADLKRGDVYDAIRTPLKPDTRLVSRDTSEQAREAYREATYPVKHFVTRSPRRTDHIRLPNIYMEHPDDYARDYPFNWGLDPYGPNGRGLEPGVTVDLYNAGPGLGPRHDRFNGNWGHYTRDFRSGFTPFHSGNPPELLPQIRKVVRHKETRKDPRPKTAIGQFVHDVKRVVPGGDPNTNTHFANSVARAIAQGVVQMPEQAASQQMHQLSIQAQGTRSQASVRSSGTRNRRVSGLKIQGINYGTGSRASGR